MATWTAKLHGVGWLPRNQCRLRAQPQLNRALGLEKGHALALKDPLGDLRSHAPWTLGDSDKMEGDQDGESIRKG